MSSYGDLEGTLKSIVADAVRDAAASVAVDMVQFPRLLTTEKAAAYLSVSELHLRNLVAADKLKPVDVSSDGRRAVWRFDRKDLDAFIDAQ
jgi:excisionase family DNA binding protein